jgi:hypothetical protein
MTYKATTYSVEYRLPGEFHQTFFRGAIRWRSGSSNPITRFHPGIPAPTTQKSPARSRRRKRETSKILPQSGGKQIASLIRPSPDGAKTRQQTPA